MCNSQEAIHTLPNARLLILVQSALLDGTGGYALLEADVGEAVDGCKKVSPLLLNTWEIGRSRLLLMRLGEMGERGVGDWVE